MKLLVPLLTATTAIGLIIVGLPGLVVEWKRVGSPDVLFQVGTSAPMVALTIDDGPSEATAEILSVLAEHGAHATFFVIGDHVRTHPELARRIIAEGHELGHHMMADAPSIGMSPEMFRTEFEEMDAILDGLGESRVFRPGSGWYDDRMVAEAGRLGYTTVLGSVYPFDAHIPSSSFASWYLRLRSEPGSILVLHDGAERGLRTADVLRSVLPELRERGIRVVTVAELQTSEARGDS